MKLSKTSSLASRSEISYLRFGVFLGFGICDLELLWILELGAWSFPYEDRPW
jgi:hypothetical protein